MSNSSEIKTLVTMLRHRGYVSYCLKLIAHDLLRRAEAQDLSKFRLDEFAGFARINHIARNHEYGSPSYHAALDQESETINRHYLRNPHHPQFYEHGIDNMLSGDIIEMVCDWVSATLTYSDNPADFQNDVLDSVKKSMKRFGIYDKYNFIIFDITWQLIRELESTYGELRPHVSPPYRSMDHATDS